MASLFKEQAQLSAYRDRRFNGTQEEFEHALLTSTTVYIGNMSFYTTEEQVYELFSRAGEIKKIIMGLDKNTKTPCGFSFVLYYSREDTEDAVKYISGTILDDRPIRVDFDWGFQEGRQWGRGRSGGQVRDEYRTDYDPGRGGYGKLVQKELEAQRELVDYGTGSLGSFPPVIPPPFIIYRKRRLEGIKMGKTKKQIVLFGLMIVLVLSAETVIGQPRQAVGEPDTDAPPDIQTSAVGTPASVADASPDAGSDSGYENHGHFRRL